jgi:hypothetical protein
MEGEDGTLGDHARLTGWFIRLWIFNGFQGEGIAAYSGPASTTRPKTQ